MPKATVLTEKLCAGKRPNMTVFDWVDFPEAAVSASQRKLTMSGKADLRRDAEN